MPLLGDKQDVLIGEQITSCPNLETNEMSLLEDKQGVGY